MINNYKKFRIPILRKSEMARDSQTGNSIVKKVTYVGPEIIRNVLLISVILLITLSSFNKESEGCSVTDYGIDISHHNGIIAWDTVRKYNDIQFVYIKATEGATHVDKRYAQNVKGASSAGFRIGSYHYFRMTSSAHDQFRNFISTISKYNQDLLPMVDVETTDKHSITETRDSLNVFISLVKAYFGKEPMIYGLNDSYNNICGPTYNGYKLYIGLPGSNPPVIKGNGNYVIWQFSNNGKIRGIPSPVDLARFNNQYTIEDILL